MKAAFALNLSHDGIGLLRRTSRGWLSIGEVSLDAPDLAEQLSYLRKTALALSPAGLGCKLVIPNSQILYTALDAPGPDEAARRAQIARGLEGMTPYPVADLVFDWRGAGPVVQVAVVARETLAEAEAFAEEFRFAPLSFVAMPDPRAFPGEPFFGPARNLAVHLPEGETLERDAEPVRIIGRGDPAPDPWPVPAAAEEPAAAPPADPVPADPVPADPVRGAAPNAEAAMQAEQATQEEQAVCADTAPGPDAMTGSEGAKDARSADPEPAPAPPSAAARDRPAEPVPPRPPKAGKARGKAAAVTAVPAAVPSAGPAAPTGAPPMVADRRAPTAPLAEIGGVTGLGARIAERRADVMASGRLLPLAAVAALVVVALLVWAAVAAFRGGGDEAPAVALVEPAGLAPIPPAPLVPEVPVAVAAAPDPAADPASGAAPAGTEAAAPEIPPAVSFAPPAQPLAVAEADDAAPPGDSAEGAPAAAPPAAALPQPPAASAEVQPATPGDPPSPAARAAAPSDAPPYAPADAIDPELRYDLTGVWTLAPGTPDAPATDRDDAGLASGRDAPPAAAPAPAELAALQRPAEVAPAPVPNPPPFAPPPRRDAQGRIIPTPDGVVTAEGVTLVAGRPPIAAPPRPAGLVPGPVPEPTAEAAPDAAPAAAEPAAPQDAPQDVAAGAAAAAAAGAVPDESAVPVLATPADAVRPPPRPAGLAPPPAEPVATPAAEDDARAPSPGTDPAAGPTEAADAPDTRLAALLPADPALAGARPRAATPAVLQRAGAAAAAAAEAARREAEVAAQLAAASPLAVASSQRPRVRPRDFSDAIAAALALAVTPEPTPAAVAPATAPAPEPQPEEDDGEPEVREAVPNIPTTAAVSREATVSRAIRLNEMNLIGVFGTPGARRALVRMPNGRFQRVEVGDRLDGGRVAAIGETELSYVKNGRTIVLALPRG